VQAHAPASGHRDLAAAVQARQQAHAQLGFGHLHSHTTRHRRNTIGLIGTVSPRHSRPPWPRRRHRAQGHAPALS